MRRAGEPGPRARALPLAALLAALAASCGGRGEPARRVLHLDPRLPDGRSSAGVLSALSRDVERLTASADPRSIAPWRLARGTLAERDGRVLLVAPDGPRSWVRLEYPVPVDAAVVDAVEVAVGSREMLRARLTWTGAAGEGSLELRAPEGTSPRFALSRRPAWSGRIESLALVMTGEGEEIELRSIALAADGFQPGHEVGESASDGGLVELGLEARRTWPADLGTPLVASASVPRGGALVLAVAAAFPGALGERGADCSVEGRAAGGAGREPGSWRRLGGLHLEGDSTTPSWRELSVDLGAFAGDAVDLRLVADDAGTAGSPGAPRPREPERARVLWGEPLVIGTPPADRAPDIVVVTLDTVRGDAVGGDTPALDELARGGIRFANAWTACNSTTPSHSSIFTGLHLQDHGVWDNRDLLAPENVTLAEELSAAGWQTAAAVSVQHLQAGTGLGQGFDRFRQAHPGAWLDGSHTVDAALAWLDEWKRAGERPFFLWVHLFDAHTPYGPPDEFLRSWAAAGGVAAPPEAVDPPTVPPPITAPHGSEWLRGISNVDHVGFLYRAGVAYADHQLGRLVEGFRDSGLDDRTLWVITADHGESLGEHFIWFDHGGLFRESLHVPLVLCPPAGLDLPRGVTSEARVSTLDIFPTLARLAGLQAPAVLRGRDLLQSLAEPDPHRRLWFEHARLSQVGTSDGTDHFIETVRSLDYGPELTAEGQVVWHSASQGTAHLLDDAPGARDRAAEEPERVAELTMLVDAWRRSLLGRERQSRDVTSAEESELRKMGYTGE